MSSPCSSKKYIVLIIYKKYSYILKNLKKIVVLILFLYSILRIKEIKTYKYNQMAALSANFDDLGEGDCFRDVDDGDLIDDRDIIIFFYHLVICFFILFLNIINLY